MTNKVKWTRFCDEMPEFGSSVIIIGVQRFDDTPPFHIEEYEAMFGVEWRTKNWMDVAYGTEEQIDELMREYYTSVHKCDAKRYMPMVGDVDDVAERKYLCWAYHSHPKMPENMELFDDISAGWQEEYEQKERKRMAYGKCEIEDMPF